MDKIDLKLLTEIDINPKISLSKLGKKLKISQQVADYRIKKLIRNGTISKFGTIINLKSLRFEHYRVFFTFNQKKYSDKEIFRFLLNRKGVYWSSRIGGRYDLLVTLFVYDFEEYDKFIDDFNQTFPGLIKDFKGCYVLEHNIYKHKYLSKDDSKISYGYNDKTQKIDDLDFHILSKIKDNCRLSSIELIKGKITYKTILNRIKNLENKNIILGYRMFIKSEEMKPFIILFSYKDYTREQEKDLLKYLGQNSTVTQTLRMFGIWNLFIHVRDNNNENIQKLIIDLRDKFELIDNYEIIPIFEDIQINLFPV